MKIICPKCNKTMKSGKKSNYFASKIDYLYLINKNKKACCDYLVSYNNDYSFIIFAAFKINRLITFTSYKNNTKYNIYFTTIKNGLTIYNNDYIKTITKKQAYIDYLYKLEKLSSFI